MKYPPTPIIIDDTYKGREPRFYKCISPTIRSEREGLKVLTCEDMKIRIPLNAIQDEGGAISSTLPSHYYKAAARDFLTAPICPHVCIMEITDMPKIIIPLNAKNGIAVTLTAVCYKYSATTLLGVAERPFGTTMTTIIELTYYGETDNNSSREHNDPPIRPNV